MDYQGGEWTWETRAMETRQVSIQIKSDRAYTDTGKLGWKGRHDLRNNWVTRWKADVTL